MHSKTPARRLWVDKPPKTRERLFFPCSYPCCMAIFESLEGIDKHFEAHDSQRILPYDSLKKTSTDTAEVKNDVNNNELKVDLETPIKMKRRKQNKKNRKEPTNTNLKKEKPKISMEMCMKYFKIQDVDLDPSFKKVWMENRELFNEKVYPLLKEANSSANEMVLRTTLNAKYLDHVLG